MKTSIKTGSGHINVLPMHHSDRIYLLINKDKSGGASAFDELTEDQAGVLIFALEQALDALAVHKAGGFQKVDCWCRVKPCSHQCELQAAAK